MGMREHMERQDREDSIGTEGEWCVGCGGYMGPGSGVSRWCISCQPEREDGMEWTECNDPDADNPKPRRRSER